MYKIFSSFILSFLVITPTLQAVGGSGAKEASGEETKSKGILKIQYVDESSFGTGVLFQEGKGQLGLSVKHCFEEFDPLKRPMFAYLGEEKREIIKVYTSAKNVDLALFVLNVPFEDKGAFPVLPKSLPDASVYQGNMYGYGHTTSSTHFGSVEESGGVCRKGEILVTPISRLESKTYKLMRQGTPTKSADTDELISFSSLHSQGTADDILSSLDDDYELNKIILDEGYVPTKDSYDWLLFSPCFMLCGDSGGPLISEDNQVYAVASSGYPNFQGSTDFVLTEDILSNKNFRKIGQFSVANEIKIDGKKIDNLELTLGFTRYDKDTLYIGLENKHIIPNKYISTSEQAICLFRAIETIFKDDLSCFLMGKSYYLHSLVKKQVNTPETVRSYLVKWLQKTHRYHVNYFTSIIKYKDWIEKTTLLSFQFIEESLKVTAAKK